MNIPDVSQSPFIGYYTDADLDGPIVRAAIQHGLPVVRCQDVEMADASDREHLEYASANRLTLVSHDAKTMTAAHERWLTEGRSHSGVIIIPRKYCKRVGEIVEYLTLVRNASRGGELDNQLWWFIP